ncbi:hypothetical protein TNIN_399851 [Trichonephila inaurata madagascariensis]|uniref:Uncharacterized protein n=1 Tax=Trichonephila inaurata madagascariensis TaxID=2747483 RepID=A0A8X6M8S6_9ARAC|nr:hypothetical protein TNIN_399851 [Trichonephila inaurata madagascariensis]
MLKETPDVEASFTELENSEVENNNSIEPVARASSLSCQQETPSRQAISEEALMGIWHPGKADRSKNSVAIASKFLCVGNVILNVVHKAVHTFLTMMHAVHLAMPNKLATVLNSPDNPSYTNVTATRLLR